jgi:hypothetical protein
LVVGAIKGDDMQMDLEGARTTEALHKDDKACKSLSKAALAAEIGCQGCNHLGADCGGMGR